MAKCGLALNIAKCEFGQPTVTFLRHQVTAGGIAPLAAKVTAITSLHRPSTVKELLRYLGMVNYYCRFLPAAARVLKPLNNALRSLPQWQQALDWTDSMQESFDSSKQLLLAAIPLAHPDPAAGIVVAADASDTHIGGVLQQRDTRGWRPLGFSAGN